VLNEVSNAKAEPGLDYETKLDRVEWSRGSVISGANVSTFSL